MNALPLAQPDPFRRLHDLVATHEYREALEYYGGLPEELQRDPLLRLEAATAEGRTGNLAAALTIAEAAEADFRASGRREDMLRALNLAGGLAFELGRLDRGEEAFRSVITGARELQQLVLLANATLNLGSIHDLRGQSDAALQLYYEALRVYQELSFSRGLAQTYQNLGIVFRKLDMSEAAESVSRLAVRHAEAEGDPGLIALCYCGQAETRLARGSLDDAARSLARAQVWCRTSPDQGCAGEIARLLARLHLLRDECALSRAEAETARQIAERTGHALLRAESAALESLALARTGHVGAARRRRGEALEGFARLGAGDLSEHFTREWNAACTAGADQD